MARKQYEIRAFRNALDDYLGTAGWSGLDFREGFKSEQVITLPSIAIHFLPSTKKELQLGGKKGEDLLTRVVQIDCYMETEDRAGAITDDIMDFIELESVIVKDPADTVIGSLICIDTHSIYSDVLAPILPEPKIKRWRGVVRATLESHVYAP